MLVRFVQAVVTIILIEDGCSNAVRMTINFGTSGKGLPSKNTARSRGAPVNGQWGSWIEGPCTKPCEGGTKIRTRQCNSPRPSRGGKKCQGNATETVICNTQKCPEGFFFSVYVDADRGSNTNSCASPELPCKDINSGMEKLLSSGTLYISGTHIMSDSIQLKESIIITSQKNKKGVIKRVGLVLFAFEIVKDLREEILVKISDIHFDGIGVLKMRSSKRSCIVEFDNIYVENTHGLSKYRSGESSFLSMTSPVSAPSSLIIRNSMFWNTSLIEVRRAKEVRIQKSHFYRDWKYTDTTVVEQTTSQCLRIIGAHLVLLEESVFDGWKHKENGGAIIITNQFSGIIVSYFGANTLIINRCRFTGCVSGDSGGALYLKGVKRLIVSKSNFTRCASNSGGAISIIDTVISGTLNTCKFRLNNARLGGGVYIRNGRQKHPSDVKIESTVFRDNSAVDFGQAIYSTARLVLNNITVISLTNISVNQLHLEGEKISIHDIFLSTSNHGNIQSNMIKTGVTVSSMKILFSGQFNFVCPAHFRSRTQRSSYLLPVAGGKPTAIQTLFSVLCESCGADFYILSTGKLNLQLQKTNKTFTDPLNITASNGKCLKCPTGAICRGDIKPLDNYWGCLTSNSDMKFFQCPPSFCCSSQTRPCTYFNTCNIGRRGTLCGSCDIGYSQSFVSNGCVRKDGKTCDTGGFVGYFLAVSMFYTIVLTFIPSIINGLKNVVARKGVAEEDIEGKLIDDLEKISKNDNGNDPALDVQTLKPQSVCNMGPPPVSAYITLITFFFQVASLVHMKIQQMHGNKENTSGSALEFQKAIFDFFNFRITVYQKLCPTDDLTLPMKEFINVALKITSISNLVIFFLFGRVFALVTRICHTSRNEQKEPSSMEHCSLHKFTAPELDEFDGSITHEVVKAFNPGQEPSLPFNSILKIGFIKLVKLSFTSITTFCFHMTSCVEIGEKLNLYLYGDLQCYVWWQKIILGAVLPLVLMFPASFGMALNLLKDGFTSTNEFLFGSVMPLYTLSLVTKSRFSGLSKHCPSKDSEACAKTILRMEEELFKENDQLCRWSVIQLYRNVLIVLINVFVLNPIYRSILFILVFGIFVLHDRHRQPYQHPYLNHLQVLSSLCLLIISACNIPTSFSMTFDVMSVPHMQVVITALQYTEIAIYIWVPFSLIIWMAIQKIPTKIKEKKLA